MFIGPCLSMPPIANSQAIQADFVALQVINSPQAPVSIEPNTGNGLVYGEDAVSAINQRLQLTQLNKTLTQLAQQIEKLELDKQRAGAEYDSDDEEFLAEMKLEHERLCFEYQKLRAESTTRAQEGKP